MSQTVIHLTYATQAERREVITRWLPQLTRESPRRRWWFVDVPIGEADGLEIGVLHARRDTCVRRDIEEWLPHGVVSSARFAEVAMVLNPALFFGAAPPQFYVKAMAQDSERAATLLMAGRAITEEDLRREIVETYAHLIRPRGERVFALNLYARWLKHSVASEPIHTDQVADPDPRTARAMYVARLAHIQAVRLLGPAYTRDDLLREAALVRGLALTVRQRARGT